MRVAVLRVLVVAPLLLRKEKARRQFALIRYISYPLVASELSLNTLSPLLLPNSYIPAANTLSTYKGRAFLHLSPVPTLPLSPQNNDPTQFDYSSVLPNMVNWMSPEEIAKDGRTSLFTPRSVIRIVSIDSMSSLQSYSLGSCTVSLAFICELRIANSIRVLYLMY